MFIHICIGTMSEQMRYGPAQLFKTLSDPTRLRLLNLLACGETCVCELTDTLRVEARREGNWMHYRWTRHGDPLVRHVLLGLRQWMANDQKMMGERRRRSQVCCRTNARKS